MHHYYRIISFTCRPHKTFFTFNFVNFCSLSFITSYVNVLYCNANPLRQKQGGRVLQSRGVFEPNSPSSSQILCHEAKLEEDLQFMLRAAAQPPKKRRLKFRTGFTNGPTIKKCQHSESKRGWWPLTTHNLFNIQ